MRVQLKAVFFIITFVLGLATTILAASNVFVLLDAQRKFSIQLEWATFVLACITLTAILLNATMYWRRRCEKSKRQTDFDRLREQQDFGGEDHIPL